MQLYAEMRKALGMPSHEKNKRHEKSAVRADIGGFGSHLAHDKIIHLRAVCPVLLTEVW